jgi:hypothetical protein
MERPLRTTAGGLVYRVLNRANARMQTFDKPENCDAFERILIEGGPHLLCDQGQWGGWRKANGLPTSCPIFSAPPISPRSRAALQATPQPAGRSRST